MESGGGLPPTLPPPSFGSALPGSSGLRGLQAHPQSALPKEKIDEIFHSMYGGIGSVDS